MANKIAIMRENCELKILESSPKAVKVVNKEMESKSGKQRLDAAKTVLRHAIPSQDERRRPTYPAMIAIETLNLIRGNQLIACQDKLKQFEEEEVIDV